MINQIKILIEEIKDYIDESVWMMGERREIAKLRLAAHRHAIKAGNSRGPYTHPQYYTHDWKFYLKLVKD